MPTSFPFTLSHPPSLWSQLLLWDPVLLADHKDTA